MATTPERALAETLRELRHELGDSQEAFADRVGLARNTIASAEIGQRTPSFQTLWRLSQGAGITLSALIARVEDKLRTSQTR
jgi:transcriptional regulator with XRE-family HTH domain